MEEEKKKKRPSENLKRVDLVQQRGNLKLQHLHPVKSAGDVLVLADTRKPNETVKTHEHTLTLKPLQRLHVSIRPQESHTHTHTNQ